MKIFKQIKKFLGLEKYTPYISNYFEKSNGLSGIYLSSVVIFLELFMLASTAYNQLFGEKKRTVTWLWMHVPCYFILLLAGFAMLIYSVRSFKNRKPNKLIGKTIYIGFSVISILFGMYISYLDYVKGEQFITLFTMVLFIFCFLSWRPIYSIIFLSLSFSIFYFICDRANEATYATQVNLAIIWVAIIMSAANNYHQKYREAKKDQRLEEVNEILLKLSISDEITGISNMSYFISQTLSDLHEKNVDVTKKLFLFLDIEHFKNFNEKYGFMSGNEFLKKIADVIEKTFSDSIVAHFSNDNFVIFTQDKNIPNKLEVIRSEIQKTDSGLTMDLKTGAYRPKNRDCLPIVACDHARYACNTIKKHFDKNYCEYNDDMNRDFYRKQHIINTIDKAIEKEYINVYYQPVVNSQTGRLSGFEALARWNDPEYGFLLPEMFINTLEEYHQIHKLDMFMLNKVCQDILEDQKAGGAVFPVSLNFSRLDFEVMDLASEVEKTLQKYGIDKKYIHVEITESALTENDGKLQKALETFRKSGYALWLDDFGSGYSGLNVLKEYEFDVMKIDMKFLQNFDGNEKSKKILKNIVSLAKDVGMLTLSEGVETEEARNFLREIGCEKLQGYLFGPPMPKAQITEKIKNGDYIPEPSLKL
ncbi:MAG: EAL domain-containing protein [Treponema sp.]|nr:EAL domain-containing protein [Treponema sp.]